MLSSRSFMTELQVSLFPHQWRCRDGQFRKGPEYRQNCRLSVYRSCLDGFIEHKAGQILPNTKRSSESSVQKAILTKLPLGTASSDVLAYLNKVGATTDKGNEKFNFSIEHNKFYGTDERKRESSSDGKPLTADKIYIFALAIKYSPLLTPALCSQLRF